VLLAEGAMDRLEDFVRTLVAAWLRFGLGGPVPAQTSRFYDQQGQARAGPRTPRGTTISTTGGARHREGAGR
jgi:hypothetical protein